MSMTRAVTEISNWNFLGIKAPVRGVDNDTTFMCTLSWNLRTSNSWNSQCFSRAAMGLRYFCFVWKHSLNVLLNGLTEENLVYLNRDGPLHGRLSYRAAAVYKGDSLPREAERKFTHFKMARVTHIERAYISATGQAVVQVVYSNAFWEQTCDLAYSHWRSLVSLLSNKSNQYMPILYEQ
jgi:hypothetical protein